jgi:hypothetical protein
VSIFNLWLDTHGKAQTRCLHATAACILVAPFSNRIGEGVGRERGNSEVRAIYSFS